MNTITEDEALNRVAAYCSAAEHCRAEVSEKLQKWGIAYEAIERILTRLEAEKYIDDERYCRAFINDKYRFAKWGKMKIGQGFYMKKIPSDVAWRYLNETSIQHLISFISKPRLIAKRINFPLSSYSSFPRTLFRLEASKSRRTARYSS